MTATPTNTQPLYLVLDVETPGLFTEQGLLEVAWTASDTLNVKNPEIESLLNADIDPDLAFDQAVAFVKTMHTASGLWKRLAKRRNNFALVSLDVIDSRIADEIEGAQEELEAFGPVYLVGNSIRLDRAVIERWLPRTAKLLHYRQIDLTSVRLFLEAWGIDTTTAETVVSTHVAGQDVLDSITYGQHLGHLVTAPRKALMEIDRDLIDMLDSLDEHINQEDVAEQLSQLRAKILQVIP
ncbi:oligoribonuclease [Microbacterium phage Hendrix]|uniref:DNA binding protein n=1 Tax=Microbacterium phage Hendrix TaxID=2182341 RepID=A0A2U8UUK7_9CAUD|nr:oligoribonuclease [Microbacterium phage Hendrix]AWN07696.1 DNA binding protein [Microbacterium phage Hendrix]